MKPRRIGLFGGTFDPVHMGHLILAERAADELKLDRVLFVPARVSPFKTGSIPADGAVRLLMLRAAVRGNRRFAVSDLELRRPGPSYTIDTIERLPAGDRLFLLVGADALAGLPRWRRPRDLAGRVTFAVFRRPGQARRRSPSYARAVEVRSPLLEISSTEIRARIRRGASVRYLVPDAVERILRRRGLYR